MQINKLQPFFTEEDKQIYLKYRQEYENWEQRTAEVTREMHAARDAGDNDRYKELLELTHVIAKAFNEGAATEWVASHNNAVLRYINSFAGDKASILADVQEIVDAATRKDFLEYLDALKEAGRPILESDPGPDSPYTKEEYNQWKKITTRNWENCVYYLRTRTRLQFQALKFNDFDTAEAVAILEAKASKLYTRTKKAATAEKAVNAETAASSQQQELSANWDHWPDTPVLHRLLEISTDEKLLIPDPKTKKAPLVIDRITGVGTIQSGNLTVSISEIGKVKGIDGTAIQLLLYIIQTFTNTGGKPRKVEFALKDYMQIRDLRDVKSARKQVVESLETLDHIKLTYYGNGKKDKIYNDFKDVEFIGDNGIQRGIVWAELGLSFYNHLLDSKVSPFPLSFYRINTNKNPYSLPWGLKILEQAAINLYNHTRRYDIISVRKLLEVTPTYPKLDSVRNSDRRITKRLLEPLERDLSCPQLAELFSWHFCHAKDIAFTQEEQDNFDFPFAEKEYLRITWKKGTPYYRGDEDNQKLQIESTSD